MCYQPEHFLRILVKGFNLQPERLIICPHYGSHSHSGFRRCFIKQYIVGIGHPPGQLLILYKIVNGKRLLTVRIAKVEAAELPGCRIIIGNTSIKGSYIQESFSGSKRRLLIILELGAFAVPFK